MRYAGVWGSGGGQHPPNARLALMRYGFRSPGRGEVGFANQAQHIALVHQEEDVTPTW